MTILDRIAAELLALDQHVNSIGGNDPDQTLSARAFAVELSGGDPFWRRVIDRLFYEGHCRQAWDAEMRKTVGLPLIEAEKDAIPYPDPPTAWGPRT